MTSPMRLLIALLLLSFQVSAENSASQDQYKVTGQFNADNSLHTGIKSDASIDFNTGWAGANFSMYGIARGNGNGGSWGVHDIVGVHGTAIKNGTFWAAGMHCGGSPVAQWPRTWGTAGAASTAARPPANATREPVRPRLSARSDRCGPLASARQRGDGPPFDQHLTNI